MARGDGPRAGPARPPAPPPDGRRANVRHVVTDDRALRRGVGRAVMEIALASARAAGFTSIRCLSTRTAAPFYAALGFRRIGETEVPLAPGIRFPAVEMWRPLA